MCEGGPKSERHAQCMGDDWDDSDDGNKSRVGQCTVHTECLGQDGLAVLPHSIHSKPGFC